MALALKQSMLARPSLGLSKRSVICSAAKPEAESRAPVAIASMVAVALASGALMPQEAQAARSVSSNSLFRVPFQRLTFLSNDSQTAILPHPSILFLPGSLLDATHDMHLVPFHSR
eukprot:gene486-1892_t